MINSWQRKSANSKITLYQRHIDTADLNKIFMINGVHLNSDNCIGSITQIQNLPSLSHETWTDRKERLRQIKQALDKFIPLSSDNPFLINTKSKVLANLSQIVLH